MAAQGVSDPRLLAAMRRVPRHLFVPPELERLAYSDRPLPIPGGQTISQPYIVAFMTEAANISPSERCLEIGTGSGYQAAVLAELCAETYSIEYLPEVAAFGRANLDRAGYLERVELRVGDGYGGWPERAPFDVILVTAAPDEVPQPLPSFAPKLVGRQNATHPNAPGPENADGPLMQLRVIRAAEPARKEPGRRFVWRLSSAHARSEGDPATLLTRHVGGSHGFASGARGTSAQSAPVQSMSTFRAPARQASRGQACPRSRSANSRTWTE